MLEPRQLNDTDREILAVMAEDGGRMTPSWIADETNNKRAYVSQRLKRLHEHSHVKKPRRGLWQLIDDPRWNDEQTALESLDDDTDTDD